MWCSAIVYGRVSPLFLGWNPSTAWPPKGASLRRCPKGILLKKGALAPFLLYCAGSGQFAVFVDAGYFWVQSTYIAHRQRTGRESVTIDYPQLRAELINEAQAQFTNADLLRVYCYDGPGTYGKTLSHQAIEAVGDFKPPTGYAQRRRGSKGGGWTDHRRPHQPGPEQIDHRRAAAFWGCRFDARCAGCAKHGHSGAPADDGAGRSHLPVFVRRDRLQNPLGRYRRAAFRQRCKRQRATEHNCGTTIQPSAGARARLRPHRPKHFCST